MYGLMPHRLQVLAALEIVGFYAAYAVSLHRVQPLIRCYGKCDYILFTATTQRWQAVRAGHYSWGNPHDRNRDLAHGATLRMESRHSIRMQFAERWSRHGTKYSELLQQ